MCLVFQCLVFSYHLNSQKNLKIRKPDFLVFSISMIITWEADAVSWLLRPSEFLTHCDPVFETILEIWSEIAQIIHKPDHCVVWNSNDIWKLNIQIRAHLHHKNWTCPFYGSSRCTLGNCLYGKFLRIGVPTQYSFSRRILKVCNLNLSRVQARYLKPKIVFSRSTNTSPVRTRS